MENGALDLKFTTALTYATGTADREGAVIDMKGFEGVIMAVQLLAVATGGANSIKAQQGAAAAMGDAADLEGTKITIADDDDNQLFVIDVYKPQERYVRLYVDKDASNACAESAMYIQYGAGSKPVIQNVTDKVTYERHVSPAEGTA